MKITATTSPLFATTILSKYLTPAALKRLAEKYDIGHIDLAWGEGDYGHLVATDTGETLGVATLADAIASYEAGYEAGYEGSIQRGRVAIYVVP